MLLVYEFMQKGSLENDLFRRKINKFKINKKKEVYLHGWIMLIAWLFGYAGNPAIEPLSWVLRLKIAIGAARGLAFLHTSEKVIYRDFKASNILLDGVSPYLLLAFGFLS